MRLPLSLLFLLACLTSPLAAGDLAAALALFNARRFPEAREALEKIVAAEPNHAAAIHYLGRAIAARNDNTAFEQALPFLARAAELEPNNAIYLGIYGGTSLQYAGRTNSYSAATKGRDAMERALTIDPGYLDAREGLFQFYQRAPWPLGSNAKAAAQLEEIRKRDPALAVNLSIVSKTTAKDYAGAFALCEEVLAKNPNDYFALYNYGRTASIAGQNLERGLERLQRCLQLEPPTPASPTHSNVWHRVGIVQQQLKRTDEARAAFQTALKLDSSNRQASDALAKLN